MIGHTKLLVGVGYTENGETNEVEIIDISSNKTCENLPNYPDQTEGAIGGVDPNNNPFICVRENCSSFQSHSWLTIPYFNSSRSYAALTPFPYSNETQKYLVTGGIGSESLSTWEILNGDDKKPSSGLLPVSINKHCMTIVNSTTILMIGGIQNDIWGSSSTYFFNTESENWIEGPALKVGRIDSTCGRIKKDSQSSQYTTIVIGGKDPEGNILSSVEILDDGSIEWQTGPELPLPNHAASLVEDSQGGVIIIGGCKGSYNLGSLLHLTDAKSNWAEMSQKLKTPRSFATAFFVPDEIVNCS